MFLLPSLRHRHNFIMTADAECLLSKAKYKAATGREQRRLSEWACLENDLSVITNPKLYSKGRFLHYRA